MKKILFILLVILFFAADCFAAASITCTDYEYNGLSGKPEVRIITYTVTFGAAAAPPTAVAMSTIVASAYGAGRSALTGWWLLRVDTYPGTTAPTANTDFRLWSVEDKIDVLEGQGLNMIDGAATYNTFGPIISHPLTGNEIFDVDPSTENLVNNAVTYIVFTLYR